ncbi:MAG TPA: hypothetical protein VK181_20520 [Rhizobium sp.]|nr:hypothetical protein [Rhizobium sp.]
MPLLSLLATSDPMTFWDALKLLIGAGVTVCLSVMGWFLRRLMDDFNKMQEKIERHALEIPETRSLAEGAKQQVAAMTKHVEGQIASVEASIKEDLERINRRQDRQEERTEQLQQHTAGILANVETLVQGNKRIEHLLMSQAAQIGLIQGQLAATPKGGNHV